MTIKVDYQPSIWVGVYLSNGRTLFLEATEGANNV